LLQIQGMDMEHKYFQMGIHIKENIKKVDFMEKECMFGLQEPSMMVISLKVVNMDKENGNHKLVKYM